MRSRETHAAISRAFDALSKPLPTIKPYPMSRSLTAMHAEWTITMKDGTERKGGAFLSTTKPRRALWRLIAHLQREVPGAQHYAACFPSLDVYCGEEQ